MKWVLTADLQFDEFTRYSTIAPSGITTRLRDMIECWKWMVSVADEFGCEGIIAVGDIFDSRTTIDLSVLDQVCRAVHDANVEHGLDIHFVAGNHDSYLRSPRINSLQVFKGCSTVWEEPGVAGKFGFLPWTEDMDAFKATPAKLAKQGAKYLFAHVMVKGAVHSAAGGIPVEALQPQLFKRVLLGDVHDPVDVGPNACYIGSPMQLDFGDAGKKRGCRVLDDETGKLTFVENTISPRFHIIEDAKTEGIKPIDFVRVKTDDSEIAASAFAKARQKTGWVETTFVAVEDLKPRLDVRTNNTDEEVLKRFCDFRGLKSAELVIVGLELLQKARAKG